MTLCSAGRLLTILTMIFVPSLAHCYSASPAAHTLINVLYLTESTNPIAEHSCCIPLLFFVMLIPSFVLSLFLFFPFLSSSFFFFFSLPFSLFPFLSPSLPLPLSISLYLSPSLYISPSTGTSSKWTRNCIADYGCALRSRVSTFVLRAGDQRESQLPNSQELGSWLSR